MPAIAASAPEPTGEPVDDPTVKIEPTLQAELNATTTDFWVRSTSISRTTSVPPSSRVG
jgi:hypothetical protein